MAKEYEEVWVYAGAYGSEDDARWDFDALKTLHKEDWIGRYQAAIFMKHDDGKVKVLDTTSTTRATGAKWGAAIGAVMGLVFPPGLLLGAAAGAGVGAVAGNLAKGWFSSDIKHLADALESGETGVLVVAEATPDVGAEKLLKKAIKAEKHMVDADASEAKRQLDEMAEDL